MITRISTKAPDDADDVNLIKKRLTMKLEISMLEKEEEDANPFKKLIDISDLLEGENDAEVIHHNLCSQMLTALP